MQTQIAGASPSDSRHWQEERPPAAGLLRSEVQDGEWAGQSQTLRSAERPEDEQSDLDLDRWIQRSPFGRVLPKAPLNGWAALDELFAIVRPRG